MILGTSLLLCFESAISDILIDEKREVAMVRPYIGADGIAYLEFDKVDGVCGQKTYRIELSKGGGKETYSAALSAMMASKQVKISVAECTGWGTEVKSLYLYK